MPQRKKNDRAYITMSEWVNEYGGKRAGDAGRGGAVRPLAFDCCALSLAPFDASASVCTLDGVVYDLKNIVPYLKRHGVDPVSGKKLRKDDLVPLVWHRNAAGHYHCPVLFKEFGEFSHIVAIRTSGNVFSWEAISELNIRAAQWKDLLTGQAFKREDIITIQDPADPTRRNTSDFFYIREGHRAQDVDLSDPASRINMTSTTESVLKELKELDRKREEELKRQQAENPKQQQQQAAQAKLTQRTSAAAPGLTSTSFSATQLVDLTPDDTPKHTSRKGYVSLQTNMGALNLELHCDTVPLACENFITLCTRGYYDGVAFHRSIRNFMIQGGDPTGSGKGGESIWKKEFRDEFRTNLSHSDSGVLSMANHGPNTNTSQFFITYKPAPHLDGKHTVFGRVVGGLDVLRQMEEVPTDAKDRPTQEIKIEKAVVVIDPFALIEKDEEEKKRKEEERKAEEEARYDEANRGEWFSNPAPEMPKTTKTGIGKYIGLAQPQKEQAKATTAPAARKRRAEDDDQAEDGPIRFSHEEDVPEIKKKRPREGVFDGW
eukprot:m51a1_g2416 putative peptidyl-prolyl cis-trans isomerase-like 2-like (546) ;mRNA; r:800009-801892